MYCPASSSIATRPSVLSIVTEEAKALTVDLTEFIRLISLDGRGGAGPFGVVGSALLPGIPFAKASSEKKDVPLPSPDILPSLTLPLDGEAGFDAPLPPFGNPMRTRASRLESWWGFSRRSAFWVASLAPGDGGRGAGFIAWATMSGIVGILHEDTTGPAMATIVNTPVRSYSHERTCIVSPDGSLHDRLHPFPNHRFFIRAEVVRLVLIVVDPEAVPPRAQVLVNSHLVPMNVHVSLQARFLLYHVSEQTSIIHNQGKKRTFFSALRRI